MSAKQLTASGVGLIVILSIVLLFSFTTKQTDIRDVCGLTFATNVVVVRAKAITDSKDVTYAWYLKHSPMAVSFLLTNGFVLAIRGDHVDSLALASKLFPEVNWTESASSLYRGGSSQAKLYWIVNTTSNDSCLIVFLR